MRQWLGVGKNFLAALSLLVILVITIRTITFPSYQLKVPICTPKESTFIPADACVQNLKEAISVRSVSYAFGNMSQSELLKLHQLIEKSFPELHSSPLVKREAINTHSLLYTITGSDPSLKPYMLCAHLDVVPIAEATRNLWTHDPFDDRSNDTEFVWGRGAMDDKGGLVTLLTAANYMVKNGREFKRTIYLAFGHDEEISGLTGAQEISSVLQKRNVALEFILDEGLFITTDGLPGLKKPLALVGVAEKGWLYMDLQLKLPGGHSSMPPPETAIGIMSKALYKLETSQMQVHFQAGSPLREMIEQVASEAKFPFNVVFSNQWFFRPFLAWFLLRNPTTASFLRTTTAITLINGGIKENVLPDEVKATVNFRIHPFDSIDSVVAHVKEVINDDRISVHVWESGPPSRISPHLHSDFGFALIRDSVSRMRDVHVAPALMIANTDTRHYWGLTKHIYRFRPFIMTTQDTKRFHGVDERVSVESLGVAVNFFYHLIDSADQPAESFLKPIREREEL